MRYKFLATFLTLLFATAVFAQQSAVDFVNPFIGTGGHGHTYPGATMPFGMVQLSPDTRLEGWDGCGGYHYDDNYIYGFSHTHLNGTGVPDYCDILVAPYTGTTKWNNGSDGKPGYGSHFSHGDEQAEAGYYKVKLTDYNVLAELTATTRAGMHSYTFNDGGMSKILFDLFHRDEVIESSIKVVSNTKIEGLRRSRSWASDQYVYFAAEFSKPFTLSEIAVDNVKKNGIKEVSKQKNVKAVFTFKTVPGEKIIVKVGISGVDVAGAWQNLTTEIPGWDFSAIKNQARQAWQTELSKIQVEGGNNDQKTIFYTALYHTMVNPNTYMDVDGRYRGRDLKVHKAADFTNYSVFSLWDTYRACHPLMTIIDRKRSLDFIKTFLTQYDQGGLLPVWELSGNETNCMIGYHSVPVIVDAFTKGITDFDTDKAFEAMKHSATNPANRGLYMLDKRGYISTDDEAESVSKTLEYAYDDWCIAQFAKATGKNDEYAYFISRAQNYKNLFNPETGFMRARTNGGWFNPFDPFEVNFNYTEANSWQYSFSVVQDMDGFMKLLGGKEKLAERLDALFSASSKTSGRDQSDITGLIGQYAHGNEPSHHIAYLYPYAGKPWKTQQIVHQILSTLYLNNPDGLTGNEDCGQMSAWAVMSALGFYPVTPGSDLYVIGTPWFEKVTLNLENGKSFVIKAQNLSPANYYIQSAKLNNVALNASFIKHNTIMQGGEIDFEMGSQPSATYGTGSGNEPVSGIYDHLIVPVPAITDATKVFTDKKEVTITSVPEAEIYYTLTGKDGLSESKQYTGPFSISQTTRIAFEARQNGLISNVAMSELIKLENDKDITLAHQPANQYSSGGANNLIDGIRCSPDFKVGGWLGFEKENLEAVIDLRSEQTVSYFGAGFLQDENSWIFMPIKVNVYVSADGKNFKPAGEVKNTIPYTKSGTFVHTFDIKTAPLKARYIKIIATNRATCPPGHKGNGGSAWMFSDELIVK